MKGMTLAVGIGTLALALAQLVWIVRTNARRYFAVQAMMMGELGVMFVLIAIVADGSARIAVSAFGLLAVGSSAILLIKVARQER